VHPAPNRSNCRKLNHFPEPLPYFNRQPLLFTVKDFFRRRIVQPILNILKQGMSPRKLATTVAVGSVVGIIPALGITTVLGTAIAARFRLNIAATVLVSYLVQPLQILLAIPFIKLGIFMFGMSEFRLSLDEMMEMFRIDWVEALGTLWVANLAGISAWAILSLPIGFVLYFLCLPVFNRFLPVATVPVAAEL
jgi:uncharacterized protein (DUF2062 family)